MVTVTSEDVERVAGEVEAARNALREAESAYAATPSPGSWTAIGEARDALERAETRARVAREQWEVSEGHRRARTEAGEAAVSELSADAERLAETRRAAVDAVVKAQAAMRRAVTALDAHDQAVRAVGLELGRRGLREEPGQETAVLMDGSPRLAGVGWPLVDGAAVLMTVLSEEVVQVWPRHPLSRVPAHVYGGVSATQGRDAVLAEVRAKRAR